MAGKRKSVSAYLEKLRIDKAQPYLRGRVLDIGCGFSPVLCYFNDAYDYTGIDENPNVIHWIKANYPFATAIQFNVQEDGLAGLLEGTFDTILMLAVVEHLQRPEALLRQLPPLLSPGGKVVLTTPTPAGHVVHAWGARLGLVYQEAADSHYQRFDEQRLRATLADCGLRVVAYGAFFFGGNQYCVAEAAQNEEILQ